MSRAVTRFVRHPGDAALFGSNLTDAQRRLREDWSIPAGEIYVEAAPSLCSKLNLGDGSIDGLSVERSEEKAFNDNWTKHDRNWYGRWHTADGGRRARML